MAYEIPEYVGDIFQAPEDSVLIHACNCQGSWGSGIAAALKKKFPAACTVYEDYCEEPDKKKLIGTSLLIPPQEDDIQTAGRYWIGCLFTSNFFGARKDRPEVISENTRDALSQLGKQIAAAEQADPGINLSDNLYTVRINALAFGVPWPVTRKVLEESGLNIVVINNLEIMRQKEYDNVTDSMQENGFSLTAPPPWEEGSEE